MSLYPTGELISGISGTNPVGASGENTTKTDYISVVHFSAARREAGRDGLTARRSRLALVRSSVNTCAPKQEVAVAVHERIAAAAAAWRARSGWRGRIHILKGRRRRCPPSLRKTPIEGGREGGRKGECLPAIAKK